MTINNPESYRTLTFEGVGTQFECKRFSSLNRFDKETGELLERDEWEYETDEDEDIEGGVVYEYLKIYLKNNDTGETECLNETKTFKELGIEVLGLENCLQEMDKEDEKVTELVDDSQLKDEDYWLLKEENLKGIWGEVDFYKGDEFEVELITITVNREGRENICRIEYDGEDLEPWELNGGGVTEDIRPY